MRSVHIRSISNPHLVLHSSTHRRTSMAFTTQSLRVYGRYRPNFVCLYRLPVRGFLSSLDSYSPHVNIADSFLYSNRGRLRLRHFSYAAGRLDFQIGAQESTTSRFLLVSTSALRATLSYFIPLRISFMGPSTFRLNSHYRHLPNSLALAVLSVFRLSP